MKNSFGARSTLHIGGTDCEIFHLAALEKKGHELNRLPYSLRILLENLLRREDGSIVSVKDIEALAGWRPGSDASREITFLPSRILMQDFTGVPAVVDLAAMRDAMADLGGDPQKINPVQPVELVIDHSIQVDAFASADAYAINQKFDYQRNGERYAFLKWGQQAFDNFKVSPPNAGICHQVNLELLARVVFGLKEDGTSQQNGRPQIYPDTLVGTDSHTPMVNGLGVLGWGVGGIEAEAAMLGQPVTMLIPKVVGFRLTGRLRPGVTATDLVLTVTDKLRRHGVVGKFVEFFGPGIARLTVADRATIGNMSPEYGATCAIFPVDEKTLEYLRFTGRSAERVELVEHYMRAQGLFHDAQSPEPLFDETLELDLSTVVPGLAGPRRPQDHIAMPDAAEAFRRDLPGLLPPAAKQSDKEAIRAVATCRINDEEVSIGHGAVVIAAITSCTNTSNPAVMTAAGLLARNAVAKGLRCKPWVKTSLAPGSRVVTDYYRKSGLDEPLEKLGFHVVGYGCTTCIGNSGPLPEPVSRAIREKDLVTASVLSGNRNFEGRINPDVRANYLMSPPLVVAFALAGRIDINLEKEPLGEDGRGNPVYLRDIWPSDKEIAQVAAASIDTEMYLRNAREIYQGDEAWDGLSVPSGDRFAWQPDSTYIRQPTFFKGMTREEPEIKPRLENARALAVFGDSITTDHISPAGSIREDSPAGEYLKAHEVAPHDFNSYGSRRGNHQVMVRGTFANVRIRNRLVPEVEGGYTRRFPDDEVVSIYDAAVDYQLEQVPLLILAGREYGSGSSRDWAAKGPFLQGVKVVIAESFERIHRSNLIGMGILPLEFMPGDSIASLDLTGEERFDFDLTPLCTSTGEAGSGGHEVKVCATRQDGEQIHFSTQVRIDTPLEMEYYRHGGILHYVLRQLCNAGQAES